MHRALATAVASASLVLLAPRPAAACGGFFCNAPPGVVTPPIAQAGENVVFAVEADGTLTAHVQVLFAGAADEFAWVLPLPAVPEISLGTDALFTALRGPTEPSFPIVEEMVGSCRPVPTCSTPPEGWVAPPPSRRTVDAAAGDTGFARSDASADTGAPPGVEVHFRANVGAYDAAVIGGTDPMAIRTWLADNGYDLPADSLPLLDGYVAAGDVFVALRLTEGRGTGEIQPIALRFAERQPCVPLRLTSIAATPAMPIRVYVLGDSVAVPVNYFAARIDEDDPELWTIPGTYARLVREAVDGAGGRAFVTEFAGRRPWPLSLALGSIEELRTETDAATIVRGLIAASFASDTLFFGVVTRFIPPPDGVSAGVFYGCLTSPGCATYDAYAASLTVDADALVDALVESIVLPRAEATAMLARHARLTRLYTEMDPSEMTEDAVLTLSPDAPEVGNVHIAVRERRCTAEHFWYTAPIALVLPSGREVEQAVGYVDRRTDAQLCAERWRAAGWRPPSSGGCSTSAPSGAAPWTGLFVLAATFAVALRARVARRGRPRA